MLVVGVTPGLKELLVPNLWKSLLPLVLKIRAAELHELWAQTPSFATGRLLRAGLACLCADLPACVMLTGGPHYKKKDAPCLRCKVHQSQIEQAPLRDSHAHGQGMLRQHVEVPLACSSQIGIPCVRPLRAQVGRCLQTLARCRKEASGSCGRTHPRKHHSA